MALVLDLCRGLSLRGLNIDIGPTRSESLAAYKAVFAPGLLQLDETQDLLATLSGPLVLGPRTNTRDANFTIRTPLGPKTENLDVQIAMTESLPPSDLHSIEGGGAVQRWLEHLEGGADVVWTLKDGRPLLMRDGAMHYLGGWLDAEGWGRLVDELLPNHTVLPKGLRLRTVDKHRVWINYSAHTIEHNGFKLGAADVFWEDI